MALLRRDCPSSYTSQNGLNFTTQCGHDVQCASGTNCVITTSSSISSLTGCMELCSQYDRPPCYSATLSSGKCILHNASTVTVTSSSSDTAFANTTQLAPPASTACPYPNLSSTTVNNATFDIYCGQDIVLNDIVPWNAPVYPHANSLQECLQYCTDAHPLCKSVAYNADVTNGFHNCYLKSSVDTGLSNPDNNAVVHSAILRSDFTADTFETNPAFKISAGDVRNGATNYSASHATDIGTCMGRCGDGCLGVILDNTFSGGWKNCYLLNNLGTSNVGANVTYAEKISDGSNTQPSGGSKAWIAGVVVGVVALLAIIAFAVWFFLRRKRAAAKKADYDALPAYSEAKKIDSPYEASPEPMHELEGGRTEVSELEGKPQISEMEGSTVHQDTLR